MLPQFPNITPKGQDIKIDGKRFAVNYAWHKGKSVSGSTLANTPCDFDTFIEQAGEMEWNYYMMLKMTYVNRLTLEIVYGFKVSNCYEDALYSPDMVYQLTEVCLKQHRKQVELYARKHNISNLPPKAVFQPAFGDLILEARLGALSKSGLITEINPIHLQPCLSLPETPHNDFILKTTFSILDKLLNHPDFDFYHNRIKITKATPYSYLVFLKHKSLMTFGEKRSFNLRDAVVLSLLVEMTLQCVAGQVWGRLKPLMQKEGFTEDNEHKFLKEGADMFKQIKDATQTKIKVTNYENIPLWDDVLD